MRSVAIHFDLWVSLAYKVSIGSRSREGGIGSALHRVVEGSGEGPIVGTHGGRTMVGGGACTGIGVV